MQEKRAYEQTGDEGWTSIQVPPVYRRHLKIISAYRQIPMYKIIGAMIEEAYAEAMKESSGGGLREQSR